MLLQFVDHSLLLIKIKRCHSHTLVLMTRLSIKQLRYKTGQAKYAEYMANIVQIFIKCYRP